MSQRVGGFGLNRDEVAFFRAGEEPLQKTLIPGRRDEDETILTALNALDFKFLSGLNAILPTDLRRKNDLAFGRDGGPHTR